MSIGFHLTDQEIHALNANAARPGNPGIATSHFTARVSIPDYATAVTGHYDIAAKQIDAPPPFRHFGLAVAFHSPTRIVLYDESRALLDGPRQAIATFGPLLLRNVVFAMAEDEPQRNIFPSLRFHVDRAPPQTDLYSLFYRDPSDPTQQHPRTSSTLFIANAVGLLQGRKEGHEAGRVLSSCDLFVNENIGPLMSRVILEQRWDAPSGTGEIAILDNRTVLHASYYKNKGGYPISVRYLR